MLHMISYTCLSFDSACEASQVHGIVTGEDDAGCHVQSITNKTLRRRLTNADSGMSPEDLRRSLVRNNSAVRRRSSIEDSEEISQDDLIRNSLLRRGSRGSSTTGDNGVNSLLRRGSRGSNTTSDNEIRRSPVPSRRTTSAELSSLNIPQHRRRASTRRSTISLLRLSSKLSLTASNFEDVNEDEDDKETNLEGVQTILRQILADDYKYVEVSIEENWNVFALGGRIDHHGFVKLVNSLLDDDNCDEEKGTMQKSTKAVVRRSLEKRSSTLNLFDESRRRQSLNSEEDEDEFHIKEALCGDSRFSAKHWSLLYCGGSQPVVDQLMSYKRKYGIDLSVEKFDW